MDRSEFVALIGRDLVVEYPFGREVQLWSMKNFYVDECGIIHHNRLPLIVESFIPLCRNPHEGKATHG